MTEDDADNGTGTEQEFTIEDAKAVLPDDVNEETIRKIAPWVDKGTDAEDLLAEVKEQRERTQELEERLDKLEHIQEQNEEMREILLAVANTVPDGSELHSRIMEVV